MIKFKKIIEILIDRVAGFFPYFFIFYIISLSIAMLYSPLRVFFDWEAFNTSLIFLGILSLFSKKWRLNRIVKKIQDKRKLIINLVIILIKLIIILSFLTYAILRGIHLINFLILLFGLIAFFFRVDIILVGIISLLFLLLCPILLHFGNDELAELFALYAYYFLIIMVIVQLKNSFFDKKITIKVKDISSY